MGFLSQGKDFSVFRAMISRKNPFSQALTWDVGRALNM